MERYGIFRQPKPKGPESNNDAQPHAQNCQCAECRVKRDRRKYGRQQSTEQR